MERSPRPPAKNCDDDMKDTRIEQNSFFFLIQVDKAASLYQGLGRGSRLRKPNFARDISEKEFNSKSPTETEEAKDTENVWDDLFSLLLVADYTRCFQTLRFVSQNFVITITPRP